MTITKKEKRIKEIKDICEKEILSSEISIPFYKMEIEKCDNEQRKSHIETKLKQIEDALAFNSRFMDYLNTI